MSLAHAYMNKFCDSCKKYLSVKPVHQYPNGEIKCGRCALSNDGGEAVWFTNISDDTLFRCINHFDGCRSLLNHWDVAAHEKSCIPQFHFPCPLCPMKEKTYTSLLLLHHLKAEHAASILAKPKLKLILSARERKTRFIYYTEEFIFVIDIVVSAASNHFEITIEPILTSGMHFSDITTKIKVYSEEPITEINLDPLINNNKLRRFKMSYSDVQKCRRITLKFMFSVDTELFSPDYTVQQHLGHIYSKIAKFDTDMELSGCKTAIMHPNGYIPSFCGLCKVPFYNKGIYKCETKKHFICSACRYFDIEKCEEGDMFFEATTEEHLLKEQKFLCKWKCAVSDRFTFLNHHEINCNKQATQKCPVSSCNHHGTLREIFTHYQDEHSFENIKMYDYWNEENAVYILKNVAHDQEWHYYIIPYDLFVRIRCQEINENYIFTLDICDKSDMNLKCCALIKCNGERGRKVEDNFTVPRDQLKLNQNGERNMDIKVFLSPKNV